MGAIELIEPVDLEPTPAPAPSNIAVVATPAKLMEIALAQSNVDLDRLERLMAMQEKWEANEARKAFVGAMAAFKAEPITIYKTKGVGYETADGGFVGYKHATLADVTAAVGPAMGRNGLSYRWDIGQREGRIHVSCIVTHKAGHSETVTMDAAPDNSGKKNAIQQAASSVQYLQRYTLLAATGMSTTDQDDDGRGGPTDDEEREADMLQGFRDASLLGTDALRAHYYTVAPPDEWWSKHSKALKDAAKKADGDGAK